VIPAAFAHVLHRFGLGRLSTLEPGPPVVRYQRQRPGELIHIEVKKLGRVDGVGHLIAGDRCHRPGPGWEYLHVCIDDATRVACSEVLADESKESAVPFPDRHARVGLRPRRPLLETAPGRPDRLVGPQHCATTHRLGQPAAHRSLDQSQFLGLTAAAVPSSRPGSPDDRSGGPGQGSPKATGTRRRAASLRRSEACGHARAMLKVVNYVRDNDT
jgi:hypothetical protein